jgi:radical SAM superfamily enzyme
MVFECPDCDGAESGCAFCAFTGKRQIVTDRDRSVAERVLDEPSSPEWARRWAEKISPRGSNDGSLA